MEDLRECTEEVEVCRVFLAADEEADENTNGAKEGDPHHPRIRLHPILN